MRTPSYSRSTRPTPSRVTRIEANGLSRRIRRRLEEARVGPAPPSPADSSPLARPSDPAERWFREHFDEAVGHTLSFLEGGGVKLEGMDVIDVGSGDGIIDLGVTLRAAPRRLVGCDLRLTDSDNLLNQARAYAAATELPAQLEFVASEPQRLPVEDASFDLALTWSAFEHVSDPVTMLREIRRVLRPGGVLFLQLWPFYRSERGSHLWEWDPTPFHHLLRHEDEVLTNIRASDRHDPGFTEYMADEFRHLNRITLEELHRSLLAGGFRVARLELMTDVIQIPPELSLYPLADLAVGGVKLLAV